MNDELENLISQSLDGLLSSEEQARLDAELGRDPEARRIYGQYVSLDISLKQSPLPNFDFDALHQRISRAIDDADAPAPIFVFPVWTRWSAGIAAAACVLIAFTIWGHRSEPQLPVAVSRTAAPTQVAIMDAGPINTQPIAALSIGPQPGLDRIDLPAREALTTPRSAVAIDSAAPPAQDTDRPLY